MSIHTTRAATSATSQAAGAGDLLGRLLAPVAAELAAVGEVFDAELQSDLPPVNTLVRHVARFRGKMLRPMLLLLAGKAVAAGTGQKVGRDHVTLAAVAEMVHMSTLVHDDVLDEAELRRKGATLNHLRGNEAAVLLGDYLISHSYHLCSSVVAPPPRDSQWAARMIGRTTNRLCEGELLQIENRNNLDLGEDVYYEIIRRKTGALTAVSSQLGAVFAGADEALAEAMERYGMLIGIAFQVQDDVLDLVGDAARVGKTLGIDVEKQKLTLPLIHFLRTAPHHHRELLRSLLRTNDPDRVEKIRHLVLPSGSVEFAQEQAGRLTREAAACLADLPQSEAKAVLAAVCEFVVAREV